MYKKGSEKMKKVEIEIVMYKKGSEKMKKVEIEIDEKLFGDWEPVAFRIPEDGEYCAYISDVANRLMLKYGRK